jgi:hypothetical protein
VRDAANAPPVAHWSIPAQPLLTGDAGDLSTSVPAWAQCARAKLQVAASTHTQRIHDTCVLSDTTAYHRLAQWLKWL